MITLITLWQLHLCFPRLGADTICAPIGVPHQQESACTIDKDRRGDRDLPRDAWLSCRTILAPVDAEKAADEFPPQGKWQLMLKEEHHG